MPEHRLSERTRADLIDIYDFTESRFGKYQAEAYYAGLIRSFELLADVRSRLAARESGSYLEKAASSKAGGVRA